MVPRVPSLNWLRVFEAAARAGSFARAAEILNMSPPAVSQQIKALEGALGQKLFLRGARSVTLTEVGRTYLPSVVRALHSIENTTVNLFGGSEERTLTVKCNLLFLTGWLAPRVLEFQRQHPHVRLTLAEDTQDNPWVAEDQCLKILFEGSFAGGDRRDVLFGEWIYPVALPQIAAEIDTAEDLLRYPLVDVPTHRANWWSFLPASEVSPLFLYADSTLTAFVIAGSGAVALARAPACGDLPERYGLVRCNGFREIEGGQSYALVHPARALTEEEELFRRWLLRTRDEAAAQD